MERTITEIDVVKTVNVHDLLKGEEKPDDQCKDQLLLQAVNTSQVSAFLK